MNVGTRPRILIGATALAGLTALGGVGAVLANETQVAGGSQAANLNVTEVATTTKKPPAGNAMAKLMSLLPKGYDSGSCAPVDNPPKDSLATVDCGQNSLPNGPAIARFSLYPDAATLDAHFEASAKADEISPCPGGIDSPGDWHYNSAPDEVAGRLVCGTYNGKPDLAWSEISKGFLGDIQGSDLESLYDFWSKNT